MFLGHAVTSWTQQRRRLDRFDRRAADGGRDQRGLPELAKRGSTIPALSVTYRT